MIDTHCHLDLLEKEHFEEAINDESLEYLITIGFDKKTCENALNIASKYDKVYCAVGFHPNDVADITEKDILWLEDLAESNKKVKAIGEIGLDYYRSKDLKDKQIEYFNIQLELAKKLGLPVVIHSRDAEEDTIKVLESHQNVGGVLHCFSGSLEFMRKGVELGFYISYSGNITFKNAQSLREVVSKTPTYRLLIETDSPWLAPVPHRGEKNKPSFIWHTAKVMSELIPNSSLEDIDRTTSANAKLCFNLGFDKNEDTITYVINNKLYINPTNKCNLHCRFCERETDRNFMVKGYWVWTRRDPSADDIIREIPNPEAYDEIVFCGYGEPTLRMDVIKEVSSYIKSKSPNTKVRVDTNGLYLAFGKKEDLENLRGLVDTFSISLNAPDENTYNEVCRPPYKNAFSLLIEFIKTVKELGFEVITTAVTYPGVDIDATEKLALELGTKFRKREWEVLG